MWGTEGQASGLWKREDKITSRSMNRWTEGPKPGMVYVGLFTIRKNYEFLCTNVGYTRQANGTKNGLLLATVIPSS